MLQFFLIHEEKKDIIDKHEAEFKFKFLQNMLPKKIKPLVDGIIIGYQKIIFLNNPIVFIINFISRINVYYKAKSNSKSF